MESSTTGTAERFARAPDRHLRQRSARGGVVTLAGQGARFAIQLGSTSILARLLDQADFGLVAMVTAVTGFVATFKDAGLSMATVQRADLTQQQVSNLFWINAALGAAMMVVVAAAAPAIAAFYQRPELLGITLCLSTAFAVGGLGVQHQAILKRELRFRALAVIDVLGMLGGVLTAVALAFAGAGYWALVANPIATNAIQVAGSWVASAWRPGRPRRGSDTGPLLRYGWNVTGFNAVNYLARNADNILIGWMWGAAPLGLYAKAYGLLLLPVQQINGPVNSVAIPALSTMQSLPERFRSFYRGAMEVAVLAGMPVVVLLFVITPEVVAIVLGPKWDGAVPIFRALAPAAFIGTTNVATGWVFLAWGHVDRQLRMGVASSLAIIVAFAAGLPWGPVGVAIAYSISQALLRIPQLVYCYADTPVRLQDFTNAVWRPAVASILAAVAAFAVDGATPALREASVVTRAFVLSAVYALAYGGLLAALPGGLKRLVQLASALRRPPAEAGSS